MVSAFVIVKARSERRILTEGVMSGFGDLVVSMLASDTQDRGFVEFFLAKKIHSMPSFGGEVRVKPSVPCRRFAACKRILRFTWKSESQAKLTGYFSPNSVLY
jgi:hypothetical protein